MTKTTKPEMPFDDEIDESLLNGSINSEELEENLLEDFNEEEELL